MLAPAEILEKVLTFGGTAGGGALLYKVADIFFQRQHGKSDEITNFRKDLMQRNLDLVEQLRLERESFDHEKTAYLKERESFRQEVNELKEEIDRLRMENRSLANSQLQLYQKILELETRISKNEGENAP